MSTCTAVAWGGSLSGEQEGRRETGSLGVTIRSCLRGCGFCLNPTVHDLSAGSDPGRPTTNTTPPPKDEHFFVPPSPHTPPDKGRSHSALNSAVLNHLQSVGFTRITPERRRHTPPCELQ